MLTAQELDEVKDYVLKELPRVLEQDPRFALFIEGILSEKFPRRDEFARLLDEFISFRTETRERFDQVDQRFDQVDQRFAGVDQRFDQVDQRFDQVDQRFDQIDQRFAEVDQRLEQMDERFDQVGQRFDQIDQRFAEVDQRLEQMDERFDQVDQRLDALGDDMRSLQDWAELVVGRFQTRAGRSLEDMVAGVLRMKLERQDIRPENVRLRQRITDTEGVVYKPGRQKEVDLVAQDGELLVFEVKSTPDEESVEGFADKVALVRHLNPDKQVTPVLVGLGFTDEAREACRRYGIRTIP